MNEILIILTNIAAELVFIAVMLIFAWLGVKLGGNTRLKNILSAKTELEDAVNKTVGKLQQEFVDNWKEANNGKLSEEQIAYLKNETLNITMDTLSQPAINVLEAAGVDLVAYLRSAAETWIAEMKKGEGLVPGQIYEAEQEV